jgi:ArsR family transcriptional regulator
MRKKLDPRDLSDDALELIAARFRLLSEASRLKIIATLHAGEMNVSQLVKATGIPQTGVSRHLQALADAGLLHRRKEGVKAYYHVADAAIFELCEHVCGSLQKSLLRQAKAARLFGA